MAFDNAKEGDIWGVRGGIESRHTATPISGFAEIGYDSGEYMSAIHGRVGFRIFADQPGSTLYGHDMRVPWKLQDAGWRQTGGCNLGSNSPLHPTDWTRSALLVDRVFLDGFPSLTDSLTGGLNFAALRDSEASNESQRRPERRSWTPPVDPRLAH